MPLTSDGSDPWLERLLKQELSFATERCTTCGYVRPESAAKWNQSCPVCREVAACRLELSDMLTMYAKKQTPRVEYAELKDWALGLTDDDMITFMHEIQRLAWKYDTKRTAPEFQRVFTAYYEALTGPLGGRTLCKRSTLSTATVKASSSPRTTKAGQKTKSSVRSKASHITH